MTERMREDVSNGSSCTSFDPEIPGLNAILLNAKGFQYYKETGLNIVIYGPPGSGKTILALQMALRASLGKRVIYFTKDTDAKTLAERIEREFSFFGIEEKDRRNFKFHFLNEIQSLLVSTKQGCQKDCKCVTCETSREVGEAKLKQLRKSEPFFAFADLDEMQGNTWNLDHYVRVRSVYNGLSRLDPNLKYIFDRMESGCDEDDVNPPKDEAKKEPEKKSEKELVVVCDSISVAHMEESVRLQSSSIPDSSSACSGANAFPRPIMIYVLETSELPKSMSAAFPPDVEIRMGVREEKHGIRTRTIQFLKTRFQRSLDEEAPYLVTSQEDSGNIALETILSCSNEKWTRDNAKNSLPNLFSSRVPGIEIFPPLAHETVEEKHVSTREKGSIIFNIKELDEFTSQHSLAGGGCTLLVTQSRCGSTALGLHYLLGQISAAIQSNDVNVEAPRSVLYISFSDDADEIINTILRYPKIRSSILGKDEPQVTPNFINGFRDAISDAKKAWAASEHGKNQAAKQEPAHRLYMVPLQHLIPGNNNLEQVQPLKPCPSGRLEHAYLYIYIPDFTWVTAEEALERVHTLLRFSHHCNPKENCAHCCKIERIIFDRVGRLQARWPLVDNCDVFVSNMVAMCARHHIEIMLVDDTADDDTLTGNVHSRWISVAQNVIRLRRITIHGNETITIELVGAAGRIIKQSRPFELSFMGSLDGYNDGLLIEDNFVGYTGLLTGNPTRCKLKVDLSYDEEQTPLHSEVLAAKHSLEGNMDEVEVRIMGPGTWSGINSAFNNLSSVSRDSCHVVAIDGIWLQSLIEDRKLHRLLPIEVYSLLPTHIQHGLDKRKFEECKDEEARRELVKKFDERYVTHTINTANASMHYQQILKQKDPKDGPPIDDGLREAIAMRHNWGIMAVVRPSKQSLRSVLSQVLQEKPAQQGGPKIAIILSFGQIAAELLKISDRASQSQKNKNIDKAVLAVLLGENENEIPDDSANGKAIFACIWKQSSGIPSWENIANFRTNYWQPFWAGGWIEDRLLRAMLGGKPIDPKVLVFPRIDLFGLAVTSEESLVSFLLELLCTQVPYEVLFRKVNDGPDDCALLDFRIEPQNAQSPENCMAGFVRTLVLFYRLLSPSLRRRIEIGFRAARTDTGVGVRDQLIDDKSDTFNAWPRQISLFSRQWITTVPNLMPCYDIRETISMRHLPGNKDATLSYWKQMGIKDTSLDILKHGIPVAGTWYLGVLKGGNSSLGVEVIKEIVSEEHERQRYLSRCGAPVSIRFYEQEADGDPPKENDIPSKNLQHTSDEIPYVDVIREMAKQAKQAKSDDPQMSDAPIYFPFHRTQIVDYLNVSMVLYDLIQSVMRFRVDDENLFSTEHENDKPAFGGLNDHVSICVENTFKRLRKLRSDSTPTDGEK